MPRLGRRWTPEETATMLSMRADRVPHEQIGAAIGRTTRQVGAKLEAMDCKARRDDKRVRSYAKGPTTTVPEASILERDHAYAKDRDYMAELMGDPRPGRSALDRLKP